MRAILSFLENEIGIDGSSGKSSQTTRVASAKLSRQWYKCIFSADMVYSIYHPAPTYLARLM